MAVARGGGGGERARTLGLIGVLPRVRPAEHVVDHLPLERRLRRHFALELEHIWARPAKEAHVLLILRQDGAASAWRAARVRARREAAHLEEQEVAAGRAEVHGSFATRRYRAGVHASLRWGFTSGTSRTVRLVLPCVASRCSNEAGECGEARRERRESGQLPNQARDRGTSKPLLSLTSMPVDVASAVPVKKPGQEPGSTIPVKILGGCAVLLMATMLYNSIGGWHAQSHGQRSVQPAALPLQRRMRKSRFARQDDSDSPSEVTPAPTRPSPSPNPRSPPSARLVRGMRTPHPGSQVMVEELITRDGKGMGKGRGGRGKGKGNGRGGGGFC